MVGGSHREDVVQVVAGRIAGTGVVIVVGVAGGHGVQDGSHAGLAGRGHRVLHSLREGAATPAVVGHQDVLT